MSRDIFTVMEKMIECVPKEDPTSQSFLDALNKRLDELSFVPPELLYDVFQFERVIKIMVEHFGENPPTEGWRKDVYDVWMDTNKKD